MLRQWTLSITDVEETLQLPAPGPSGPRGTNKKRRKERDLSVVVSSYMTLSARQHPTRRAKGRGAWAVTRVRTLYIPPALTMLPKVHSNKLDFNVLSAGKAPEWMPIASSCATIVIP